MTEGAATSILDLLRVGANDAVADYDGTRRPTWAPPLALAGELVTVLRSLGALSTPDKDVARLWARYTSPKRGDVQCIGFELRAGTSRSGKKFFETSPPYSNIHGEILVGEGPWHHGPRWRSPEELGGRWAKDERWIKAYPMMVRAAELGAQRVLTFAGNLGEEMQLGGVLTGRCACCGKDLWDPISLERGIGPECHAKFLGWLRRRQERAQVNASPEVAS